MTGCDKEGNMHYDVEDAVNEAWRGHANAGEYVDIDRVDERLRSRGINMDRAELAEQMRMLAALRGWKTTEGFGDKVSVYLR